MAHPVLSPSVQRSLCVALLVIALFGVPDGSAQGVTAFAVQLSTAEAQKTTTGACVDFQGTVRNTGQSPLPPTHTIRLTFAEPPTGWTATAPADPEYELAPDESAGFTYRLCPPVEADDGATAAVTVTATVTTDPNNPKASDTQTFSVMYEQEGVFGLDLPDAALYVAVAAVLGLLGVVLLTRRRPAAGLVMSCPEPAKEVLPNRGTSFPVRVRNEGRARDVVSLTTSPVPRGWDTFLPLVDIPLEPREEQTVWLSVKSPPEAEPGDHVVVKVIARSSASGGESAEIDTLTTVREPEPAEVPHDGSPAAPRTETSVPLEEVDEERSVYGPEDEAPPSKPVAVKRRKA